MSWLQKTHTHTHVSIYWNYYMLWQNWHRLRTLWVRNSIELRRLNKQRHRIDIYSIHLNTKHTHTLIIRFIFNLMLHFEMSKLFGYSLNIRVFISLAPRALCQSYCSLLVLAKNICMHFVMTFENFVCWSNWLDFPLLNSINKMPFAIAFDLKIISNKITVSYLIWMHAVWTVISVDTLQIFTITFSINNLFVGRYSFFFLLSLDSNSVCVNFLANKIYHFDCQLHIFFLHEETASKWT